MAEAKHRRRWPFNRALLIFSAALGGALVLFGALNTRAIILGVRVDGVKLGGLSKSEAIATLQAELTNRNPTLTFSTNQGAHIRVPRRALPFHADVSATVDRAFAVGHEPDVVLSVRDQALGLTGQINLPFAVTGDDQALETFIASFLHSLETPVQEGAVVVRNRQLAIVPAAPGILVDRHALIIALSAALASRGADTVRVVLSITDPVISTLEAEAARAQAQSIMDRGPYAVRVSNETVWTIDEPLLLSWLTFPYAGRLGVDVDRAKIAEFLRSVAPAASHPAVNAVLGERDGAVVVETPDVAGLELDISQTADRLHENILGDVRTTDAVIRITPAKIRSSNLAALGLTSLLVVGETSFSGSSKNRTHNIAIGAARFNSMLIGPGEEFSFNNRLGAVGPDQGYLPELVIKGDRTIPEYGGGLCQVATTLFRAVVKAGQAITERQAHSYVVRYYNPIGFDATIYPPYTDLKFKNTASNNIYIQSAIIGSKLRFTVFGANDGRTVKIIGPSVYDEQPDGSMKATMTQEVLDATGAVVYKKVFNSVYKSPALYPVIKNPLE